jgi:hypothetical protein
MRKIIVLAIGIFYCGTAFAHDFTNSAVADTLTQAIQKSLEDGRYVCRYMGYNDAYHEWIEVIDEGTGAAWAAVHAGIICT